MSVVSVGAAPAGPVRAESSCEAPDRSIEAHRGFAFDGVIREIAAHDAPGHPGLARITFDVSEMLLGEPRDEIVIDLGDGGCQDLLGERFKVGDRIILSAAAPPVEPAEQDGARFLDGGYVWRYEWGSLWRFHGYDETVLRSIPRPVRSASTWDAIVALVAPSALPYAIDHDRWRVASIPLSRGERLRDMIAWQDGFVAAANRGGTLTTWISATGERWRRTADGIPLPRGAALHQLVTFDGALYALAHRGGRVLVFRSEDARRWTRVLDEEWRDPPIEVLDVGEVTGAATDSRLVVFAHGSGPEIADQRVTWATTDGLTWTRTPTTGLTSDGSPMFTSADRFLIADGELGIQASRDGVDWIEAGTRPSESGDLGYDQPRSRFLATAPADGITILESEDLATWTPLLSVPWLDGWAFGAAEVGETIALLGDRSWPYPVRAWTLLSDDAGVTWTYSELPGSRLACGSELVVGATRVVVLNQCEGPALWIADR